MTSPGATQPGLTEPGQGLLDAMPAYADAMRPFVWTMRNTQAMIELNQALFEIGRELAQRQQEAMLEATLRMFGAVPKPGERPGGDAFSGFARLTVEAFDRMAAARRASNDPGRWTGTGR